VTRAAPPRALTGIANARHDFRLPAGAYPMYERDPFVLADDGLQCPHVYFAGNQPEYATRLVQGEVLSSCVTGMHKFPLTAGRPQSGDPHGTHRPRGPASAPGPGACVRAQTDSSARQPSNAGDALRDVQRAGARTHQHGDLINADMHVALTVQYRKLTRLAMWTSHSAAWAGSS